MKVIVIAFFCGCCGSFLSAVCGFGLGIFTMIFLPHVMPTTAESAAVVGITSIIQSEIIVAKNLEYVRWKDMIPMIAGNLIFSTLAMRFVVKTQNSILTAMLGVFLIVLSIYFAFFTKKLTIRPTPAKGFLAGCIGGTLATLFSVGGPPASIYYSSCYEDKIVYLATIQAYFLLTNIYITAERAIFGTITKAVLIASVGSVLGMFLGTWLGKKLFDRINEATLRKIIYLMMAASGILLIV